MLQQSYAKLEVLVVDDSAQGTAATVCANLNDGRIRYCRNTRAKGACGSRNTGISLARGSFYTGLDDDDFFHRDRIRVLLDRYESRYAFVTANTLELRPAGAIARFQGGLTIALRDILWSNCAGNQIFTETSKVRSVGGFDESLASQQDRDLWIRMIDRWGVALRLPECLYNLDVSHAGARITTSASRLKGLRDFARLHRGRMTRGQRMLADLRIRRSGGEPYLLRAMTALCMPHSWEYLYKRAKKIW